MSLKDTIVYWNQGVDKAQEEKYLEAIDIWTSMQEPGARILFNVASMHFMLGNLDNAERNLELSVQKDPHLALAYFMRGGIRLQRGSYLDAVSDFDCALKNLRGNVMIDYKQLGLQYKLYSCEVMYNHAYGLYSLGRLAEAKEELEKAKSIAATTTESRHKLIITALENIKSGTKLCPFKAPQKALIFQPPRNKTEVLKPVNFLGKAKVLSSVVDQDNFVGFVGAQEEKKRRKSPSSRPGVSPPPPPYHSPHPPPPSTSRPNSLPHGDKDGPVRMPKPDLPPPVPNMKIQRRSSSLTKKEDEKKKPPRPPSDLSRKSSNSSTEFKKVNAVQARPPKPSMPPPPLQSNGTSEKDPVKVLKSPDGSKPNPKKGGMMTVKVHYATTRALRVSSSVTYQQLQHLICKKFDSPEDSLTLWCKKKNGGDLYEINSEQVLKEVTSSLDDGFRLTLWAYDKHESDSEEAPVLMECVATHDYTGQYEDELAFNAGDTVEVTADINDDWYEGRCNGKIGIFPKSYVKTL